MSITIGQVYKSNAGNGPLIAKVVAVLPDGRVRLFRRDGGKASVYFTLPARFFDSPSCGWALQRRRSRDA